MYNNSFTHKKINLQEMAKMLSAQVLTCLDPCLFNAETLSKGPTQDMFKHELKTVKAVYMLTVSFGIYFKAHRHVTPLNPPINIH